MLFDKFRTQFPDEESCINYLKNLRLEQGICCKKCEEETEHYWLPSIKSFQCKICRSRKTVKSGTLFQDTNLPLLLCFEVLYLMTSSKKGYSALEIQKQVEHSRYEPIWYLCQKIRYAMGERDALYQLKGLLEIDDAFFKVVDKKKEAEKEIEPKEKPPLKRGRGSEQQQVVMVITEYEPKEQKSKPYRKQSGLKFIKMKVMDNLEADNVNEKLEDSVHKDSSAKTDGYGSYAKLKKIIKGHDRQVIPAKQAHKKLPWVHTIIGNAKKIIRGIHHSVSREYLQNYLNEFSYKVNRRFFHSILDRSLIMAANHQW